MTRPPSTIAGPFATRRRSGVVNGHRADVVHLAELDAVVAQDRVRHGNVEIEVGDGDLPEVVGAAEPLPLQPWRRNPPGGGAGILRRLHALEVLHAGLDARAQLADRLLGVRM